MKKRGLALATAVAAAVTLALPATALASTSAAGATGSSAATTVFVPSFNPKLAHCSPATSSGPTVQHCTQAERIPLKDLTTAQRAERQRAMEKIAARAKAARKAAASASRAASAAAAITAPAQCEFSSTQFVLSVASNPSRYVSCSDVLWTITSLTVTDGTPIITGFFEYEDQSWNLYSRTSLGWNHGMQTIGYTDGFGTMEDGVSGLLTSNCTPSPHCSAISLTTPDPQFVAIAPGGTYTFAWDESDIGPATTTFGSVDTLTPFLGVTWDITTPEPGTTGAETGFLAARCDFTFRNSRGCVDQGFTPTLFLSLVRYGSSAAMIQFAQASMSAHWGQPGVGSPLTRLAAGGAANRRVICNGTFVNQGARIGGNDGDRDSCDEFPFAATYQSGTLNGVTSGAQCAQVTAVSSGTTTGNEAADWPAVAVLGTPTLNEACVRGHIPLRLNNAVGGAYGALIIANRLIDKDPFWVTVTP